MNEEPLEREENQDYPSIWLALLPVAFLIILIAISVYIFGSSSMEGANQISLILASMLAALLATFKGKDWKSIINQAINSVSSAIRSILILLMIGALTGAWLISGIIPAMIYYGLQFLNPTFLLFSVCIICAIISVATGSSWTTVATIGIALLGIGKIMGIPEGWIGGAIISGAYFGDKISPMSDTTNLAAAMAGTELFTHIRYMMLTTVPSILISLVIFFGYGFSLNFDGQSIDVSSFITALESTFTIHPVLFIVPVIVLILIVKKVPPIPARTWGAMLGAMAALIFQQDIVYGIGKTVLTELNDGNWDSNTQKPVIIFAGIVRSLYGNTSITTGIPALNELLTSSGMAGMLNTIWLIVCALTFGGIMEAGAFLEVIAISIVKRANSVSSLVGSTIGTCIFFNLTASDQYISIVIPGRMFKATYEKKGLQPELLSRTLEDSGTVTSVLIPWNTCGATQSSVLGVATITYLPFCFFNMLSPVMSMLMAVLNIKIKKPAKEL